VRGRVGIGVDVAFVATNKQKKCKGCETDPKRNIRLKGDSFQAGGGEQRGCKFVGSLGIDQIRRGSGINGQ
jgi:hypothetical protein